MYKNVKKKTNYSTNEHLTSKLSLAIKSDYKSKKVINFSLKKTYETIKIT